MNAFPDMNARDQAHLSEFPKEQDERANAGEPSQIYCASTLKGRPVKPREWLVHGLDGHSVLRRWRHRQEPPVAATCGIGRHRSRLDWQRSV